MSDFSALVLLLVLGATVGLWLKLSVARERAVRVARQECRRHGLQLLDETVGLRALRLRRIDGLRRLERGYGFEVSVDGHDREPGRLWMIGEALTDLSLPVTEPAVAADRPGDDLGGASGKVVALRPRRADRQP